MSGWVTITGCNMQDSCRHQSGTMRADRWWVMSPMYLCLQEWCQLCCNGAKSERRVEAPRLLGHTHSLRAFPEVYSRGINEYYEGNKPSWHELCLLNLLLNHFQHEQISFFFPLHTLVRTHFVMLYNHVIKTRYLAHTVQTSTPI